MAASTFSDDSRCQITSNFGSLVSNSYQFDQKKHFTALVSGAWRTYLKKKHIRSPMHSILTVSLFFFNL